MIITLMMTPSRAVCFLQWRGELERQFRRSAVSSACGRLMSAARRAETERRIDALAMKTDDPVRPNASVMSIGRVVCAKSS